MLLDTGLEETRAKYRSRLVHYVGLWSEGAVALLQRLTDRGVVVLVTGSEQLQTEECVRLLDGTGVRIDRIVVRGSLYGFDAEQQRFTGGVQQLNVTLDGKRDAVDSLCATPDLRIVGAVGNSRPDRALFEAVIPEGICVLVCPPSVVQGRKRSTFVIRKLQRNGFRLVWDAAAYPSLVDEFASSLAAEQRPVLADDHTFQTLLENESLQPLLDRLLAPASDEAGSAARLYRAG
jgi:phosphoserine phosphatase